MTAQGGFGAYTRTQVTTATNQRDLIVMAYDGILKYLAAARDSIERREIENSHNWLVRARDIIEELAGTLNREAGGQIAENLWNLYVFFSKKITEANLTKRASHIDDILPAVRDLRDGWASMEITKDDVKTQALNQRVPAPEDSHRLSVAG